MLLSFPFLLLRIPGLKLILTHAKRTGYTRHGVCVPWVKPKYSRVYRDPITQLPKNSGNANYLTCMPCFSCELCAGGLCRCFERFGEGGLSEEGDEFFGDN